MATVKTRTMSVNAVGDPETLSASILCRRVHVSEDRSVAGYPTVALKARGPLITDTAVQRDVGEGFTFEAPSGFWRANDTVAFIETVSGSTTVQIIEEV